MADFNKARRPSSNNLPLSTHSFPLDPFRCGLFLKHEERNVFWKAHQLLHCFSTAGWEKGVQSPPGGVGERGPEWASFCPLLWLGSRSMGKALPTHPPVSRKNRERVRRYLFPETLRYLPQNTVPAKPENRSIQARTVCRRKWKSRDRAPSFCPRKPVSTPVSKQAGASSA